MKGFLHNLFLPHSGNNHRSKLLHPKILIIVITFLFATSLISPIIKTNFPEILGISSDITTEELLTLTNQKRVENGLAPLQFNKELAFAAQAKAEDMFSKDYWAHNAPDGITPWHFIKKSGYEYKYAGENLARGFTNSSDIVDAWMKSTSHRENMLSKNYEDIGFALMEGTLNGQETILVVEMFGNKGFPRALVRQSPQEVLIESPQETSLSSSSVLASIRNTPFISTNSLPRSIGLWVVFMFIFAFVLDMIIVERKKIVRLVGHNIDHIFFLGMILLTILLIRGGVIL